MRRFNRPKQLAASVGLNPGQRTSSTGKKLKVGVGKRGREEMRHLLIQSRRNLLRSGILHKKP
ncbi:MAG: transposase [Verrucomicrobiota bacterium]